MLWEENYLKIMAEGEAAKLGSVARSLWTTFATTTTSMIYENNNL